MKNKIIKFIQLTITLSIVAAAIFLGMKLWNNYTNTPWTRDGKIRADLTLVASDVNGLVSKVFVKDNQYVKEGEKLFELDKERFKIQIAKQNYVVKAKKIDFLKKQTKYNKRKNASNSIISKDIKDDLKYDLFLAKQTYNEAKTKLEILKLDLERSIIYAPASGWINNLLLKKGDFVKKGSSPLSILNEDSFWVYGYFEEQKIVNIKIGDKATINPLGTNVTLKGRVKSIATAITDRENQTGSRLLSNINPSFSWVRLAQRFPVRIELDEIPKDYILRAGTTCTVQIIK